MTSISKPKPVLGLSDDSPAQAFQMWHQHVEAKWNKPNKLHVRDKKYAADDLTFLDLAVKNFQILRPPKFLRLEGCSTAATRMPRNQQVTRVRLPRSAAFFLFLCLFFSVAST